MAFFLLLGNFFLRTPLLAVLLMGSSSVYPPPSHPHPGYPPSWYSTPTYPLRGYPPPGYPHLATLPLGMLFLGLIMKVHPKSRLKSTMSI
uniref:NADH dehydrogenase subunit 6 n=1 Tax=Ditylenchus dipsaci TaxID=166011 RepID=A0A915DHZ7_9BILA